MTVEVVKPGLLTTLQDAGRVGFAHLGVGRTGAFDPPALRIANMLCGNPATACGLEITLLGPTLRLHADAWIAVTGAPVPVRIDGRDVPMWAPLPVRGGATVVLGAMRAGCRSYLAVHGGFDVVAVLGSRSMDVNARIGPFDGNPLREGDELPVAKVRDGTPTHDPTSSTWRLDPRPWFDDGARKPLRLLSGSHLDRLTPISHNALFSKSFMVQADSNRVGLRLSGTRLEFREPVETVSEGCVPGLLQLPPSGQPIAFGPECPVSGGYPRLGQVAAVDIPRLAQLRPGDALRFEPIAFDAALAALRKRERALQELQAAIRNRLEMG